MIQLGVNIDHVATIRQARYREMPDSPNAEPDPVAAAMAAELGKLGAGVEAGADYLKVTPHRLNAGIAVDTYDDHRMAMSLSLAALGGVAVRINDPDCVAKTFPDYFRVFARIAQ